MTIFDPFSPRRIRENNGLRGTFEDFRICVMFALETDAGTILDPFSDLICRMSMHKKRRSLPTQATFSQAREISCQIICDTLTTGPSPSLSGAQDVAREGWHLSANSGRSILGANILAQIVFKRGPKASR